MLAEGVIEPCSGEWASPIVVVRKKDFTIRLCVDYKRLNAETLMDAYPMPQFDEILDQLGQAKYLSNLNLVKGYRARWCLWDHRGCINFVWCHLVSVEYQWLSNAWRTMSLEKWVKLLVFTHCVQYDMEDRLVHLQEVLNHLQVLGLTAKLAS